MPDRPQSAPPRAVRRPSAPENLCFLRSFSPQKEPQLIEKSKHAPLVGGRNEPGTNPSQTHSNPHRTPLEPQA
jgi:hypothetical protein